MKAQTRWATLFTALWSLRGAWGVAIDNGILGVPRIQCGRTQIDISFETQRGFEGRVYIKGYSEQPSCVIRGTGKPGINMPITFDRCGVRRARQVQPTGIGVSTIVIISFHPIFLTKVDRAYRVNCFYMEATKTVEQELFVSMLTTQTLDENLPMPVCRYEILRGGFQGTPIRFAQIGDSVYHKWTCASDNINMFCMRVHTCKVGDGQGGQPVLILDERGCAVDRYVLRNLDYMSDLMAGQESHVFKFADKPALYFDCQIELTLRDASFGCVNVQPSCPRINNNEDGGGQTLPTDGQTPAVIGPGDPLPTQPQTYGDNRPPPPPPQASQVDYPGPPVDYVPQLKQAQPPYAAETSGDLPYDRGYQRDQAVKVQQQDWAKGIRKLPPPPQNPPHINRLRLPQPAVATAFSSGQERERQQRLGFRPLRELHQGDAGDAAVLSGPDQIALASNYPQPVGRSSRSLESQGWAADFDLPEQQLFVFEIPDGPDEDVTPESIYEDLMASHNGSGKYQHSANQLALPDQSAKSAEVCLAVESLAAVVVLGVGGFMGVTFAAVCCVLRRRGSMGQGITAKLRR